jgi:glycerol-3-phosphate dehydrogenase
MDARERGARILTRTTCTAAQRDGDMWRATLQAESGCQYQVNARAMVNAAGPWTAQFAQAVQNGKNHYGLRLIKGSHIVVPRLFDHPYAYIFQNPDKRIIFAIPYQGDFTLIGTTDLEYTGDPGHVSIDAQEVAYLCEMANRYFTRQISAQDVVWSYSGVRPLLDDSAQNASAITRDYLLEYDGNGAPLLNIWGGKITTYRKLAEEAMAMLLPGLKLAAPTWTATQPLPGGDLEQSGKLVSRYDFERFLRGFAQAYPWLPKPLAQRYARHYGTRAAGMLAGASKMADLGEELSPGLHVIEARYLCQQEWACTAEDILWRRTKLGLYSKPEQVARLKAWLEQEQKLAQAGAPMVAI